MGERSCSVDGAGWEDMAAAGRAERRGETMLLTSGGLMVEDMAGMAIIGGNIGKDLDSPVPLPPCYIAVFSAADVAGDR
jgi:hypothetical protein